jgi:hypothetical protein
MHRVVNVRLVFAERHQHADAPHAVALLRARRERPRHRAAESSDEFAPSKANAHLPLPSPWDAIRIARPGVRSLPLRRGFCPSVEGNILGYLATA